MADNSQTGYQSQEGNQDQQDNATSQAEGQQDVNASDVKNEGGKSQDGGDSGKQQATAGIPGKDDERKLFVGGLTRNTTESELKEYFGKYGDIESVSIKMDPYTGVSRGFAFMVFQNPKAIDKLLASGDHYINKRKVGFDLWIGIRYEENRKLRFGTNRSCIESWGINE